MAVNASTTCARQVGSVSAQHVWCVFPRTRTHGPPLPLGVPIIPVRVRRLLCFYILSEVRQKKTVR